MERKLGTFNFSAQYQQNPFPVDGNLVKRDWFQTYAKLPPRDVMDAVVLSWDTRSEREATAHLSANSVAPADLPELIKGVYDALASPMAPTPPAAEPAVPIKKSVTPNHIVCLEDGKKFRTLRRHLRAVHNVSPEEYRAKWRLPSTYPMAAPAYAEQRREMAKAIGLGKPRAKGRQKRKRKSAGRS